MTAYENIGILGCGWLGKATAQALISKGYKVKGSVTSAERIEDLKRSGVDPYVIKLDKSDEIKNLKAFLHNLEILIIAIPPKIKHSEYTLLDSLKLMFKNYDINHIDKLIYISSTGVFKDGIDAVYNEDSKPNNTSERAKLLINLENLVLSQKSTFKSVILRYGGLIKHGGRHPVRFLSSKKNIANPESPVNLIEQKDAVKLLIRIIEIDCQQNIFHGVYPAHPSREKYYSAKAKELGLSQPEFDQSKKSDGKTISSDKTQKILKFNFESGI